MAVEAIESARVAFDAHRWVDARVLLAGIPVDELDIDDLDRLATASYLTGHDEEGFSLWLRAHQACAEQASVHRAAHFGMRLAQGLGFKGDLARCGGWIDRTGRLLEEAGIDCVEQGYLEYGRAMVRLFEHGDAAGAQALFVRAGKIASRYGDRDLVTLTRIGEGRMSVYLGEIAEGMALLDEAMVSIEAGELSPIATGDAYCTVIDACAELFDVGRCRSWSESFERWCDGQQGLVLYRGHCFVHRADVLGFLGAWPQALAEARRACDRLAKPVHPMALGAAFLIEGDLLRLGGDLDEAERSYARANDLGREPQPGLALLRLAEGRVDIADAMIRRALGESEDPISRARLLDPFVEIVLAAGDITAAGAASQELRATANELGTSLLRARASRSAGSVLLADGDASAALLELRRALNDFNELTTPYDAARTRLLIARACDALGDHDTATMETGSARDALESLGAAGVNRGEGSAVAAPHGLTAREVEVLRLLARGKTNRVIAEELFVSEKTVASHVSHIFTKLDVTSRAAATAHAYDHNLVRP